MRRRIASFQENSRIGLFSPAFLLFILCLIYNGPAFSEDISTPRACPAAEYTKQVQKQRGWKGRLSLACAREILFSANSLDPSIEGYVIDDENVENFIVKGNKEGNLRISKSVLEIALVMNFKNLPPIGERERKILKTETMYGRIASPVLFSGAVSLIDSDVKLVGIDNVYFKRGFSIERSDVRNSVEFANSFVEGSLYIVDTTVRRDFTFESSVVRGNIEMPNSFAATRILGSASFDHSVFEKSQQLFRETEFERTASFREAHFFGEPNWSKIVFGGDAYFDFVHFHDNVSFIKSKFSGNSTFFAATFDKDVIFGACTFERVALFRSGIFQGMLDVRQTQFAELADFRDARIKLLDWNNSGAFKRVTGRIDFRGAKIVDLVIVNTLFDQLLTFSNAELGATMDQENRSIAIFRRVEFQQPVEFRRAKFLGYAEFADVRFQKGVDFLNASFQHRRQFGKQIFHLSEVEFGPLRLKWEQLPEPSEWALLPLDLDSDPRFRVPVRMRDKLRDRAQGQMLRSELYASLETSFRSQGQLDDANRARYYAEVENANEENSHAQGIDAVWLKFVELGWGWPTGYGTRLPRIVTIVFLIWLAFGVVFFGLGCIYRAKVSEDSDDDRPRLHLLELPSSFIVSAPAQSPEELSKRVSLGLQLSCLLLLKVGRRSIRIANVKGGVIFGSLLWGEWVVGYYVLALLLVTLANTQPILNALLRGVF